MKPGWLDSFTDDEAVGDSELKTDFHRSSVIALRVIPQLIDRMLTKKSMGLFPRGAASASDVTQTGDSVSRAHDVDNAGAWAHICATFQSVRGASWEAFPRRA